MLKLPLSLCVMAALGAAACSKPPRSGAASSASAGASNPQTPVARVSGQVITSGELDKAAKPKLARIESEYAEQVHGTKTQTLDEMIDKRLLEAKAKSEGITVEKLVEREVTSKVASPSDGEVRSAYDKMVASGRQLPPFDQIKGQLVNFLKERGTEDVRKAYVGKLRTDAKVEVMLPPLLPPKVEVAAEGPARGEDKAPITIVEFSDFECPYCVRAEESVKQVMDTYKGKVRLVYRDYPLEFHSKAQKASEAALCAGDQGKYWEMHAKLFANQKALDVPQLKQHAKDVGVESGKFDKCLDGGDKAKDVAAHKKAGEEAGVTGTPAFFINGRPLTGAQPFEKFKEIIDHELSASR
jgi:protein-disulfide isomerase